MIPDFFLLNLLLGAIHIGIDCYVAYHWMQFVHRRQWNPWLYRAGWLAVLTMSIFFIVSLTWRKLTGNLSFNSPVVFVTMLWMLPKIPVAIVLLVRDSTKLMWMLIRRIGDGISPTQNKQDARNDSAMDMESYSSGRRRFVAGALFASASTPFFMVGRGMFDTVYDFQIYQREVWIPKLPKQFDGLRIVQISDIHAGSFLDHRPLEEACRLISECKPDMIVVTGDFVNSLHSELLEIGKPLAKLKADLGVWGCLGNHDHYHDDAEHKRLINVIDQAGIKLLINSHTRFNIGRESLILAGVDNTGMKQSYARLDHALEHVDEAEAVLLLAHDPTFYSLGNMAATPVSLMLSGHTHGGQVGFTFPGYEWSPARYVYKHWAGLYQEGSQYIYVNRGLGTVGPPIRIGIPPEITSITIRSSFATA